jgi:hypothetical protein
MALDVIHRYLEHGTGFHAILTCGHLKVALEVLWAQSQSHFTTDGQLAGLSWCRASSGAHDQILIIF